MTIKNKAGLITLATGLIFLATFQYFIYPQQIGLDASYLWANNWFFSQGIETGKDYYFTYGPLGFIQFPMPMGHHILISAVFIYLYRLCFIASALYLMSVFKESKTIGQWIFNLLFLTYICYLIDLYHLFLFLFVSVILLHYKTHQVRWLGLLSLLLAIALLIRLSLGVIGFLFVFSYALYGLFLQKKGILFWCFPITFCCLMLIWFILYGHLEGLMPYFQSFIPFSSGNSSIMSKNPANNWFFLIAFLGFMLALLLHSKNRDFYFLYWICALPFYAYFKHSIVREDHIVALMYPLVLFTFYLFILIKTIDWRQVALVCLSFYALLSFINATPYAFPYYHLYNNIHNGFHSFYRFIFHYAELEQQIKQQSEHNLVPAILTPELRQKIGNDTIDFYPWELAFIEANQFNWRFRPVLQMYISYLPIFDQLNLAHFKSKKAPHYVLWDNLKIGLDDRDLLNDEPLTFGFILNQYQIVFQNRKYTLFERVKTPQLLATHYDKKQKVDWQEWIKVPYPALKPEQILSAQVFIERTGLQKLKKTVYKEAEVYLHCQYNTGEFKRVRLVVDHLANGIWINPVFDTLFRPNPNKKVVKIGFSFAKDDFFKAPFELQWVRRDYKRTLFSSHDIPIK